MTRRGYDVDDHEQFDRPRRHTRPRTKERPAHLEAISAFVVAVDRGRYTCLVSGEHGDRLITAMKSRPLGRKGVVVGDRVRIVGDVSGDSGSLARIVEVMPRATVLRRTADDDDPVERVVVANADQLVVVAALADPPPRRRLIDRCLVAAYDAGLEPLLCLTKPDLADPEDLLSIYRPLGVPYVITHRGKQLSDIKDRLINRVSVLVGHSGVGKSTLVNGLVPGTDRAIGHVNIVTGRGRHTSTSVVALPAAVRWLGRRHAGDPVLRARPRRRQPDHRGVPGPCRAHRSLSARLHARRGRTRVRARPGAGQRGDRRRTRGVFPAPARQPRPARRRLNQRPRRAVGSAPGGVLRVHDSGSGLTGADHLDDDDDRRENQQSTHCVLKRLGPHSSALTSTGPKPRRAPQHPRGGERHHGEPDHEQSQGLRETLVMVDRCASEPQVGPEREAALHRDEDVDKRDDGERHERPSQQVAPPGQRHEEDGAQGRQRDEDDFRVHDEHVEWRAHGTHRTSRPSQAVDW